MTGLLLAAILAPLAASIASLITGWRRTTATLTALSATTVLACAVAMGFWMGSGAQFGLGGLLRADALTVVMLVVIGIVGTLATAASIGYIDTELAHGHIDGRSARLYGVLTPAFLCAMVLAVCANNIGVIWVAIEATTVITAFLVGHRRTRTALEATWKYVVICSVGIAVAFLGTVLLYFAARDSGAAAAGALNLDILAAHAAGLDPGVARLAGGLLLIGYGAKAGLFPFHTWLADAHSQAPAPVSALMSGVLLAVAFSVLIRLRPILDAVSGPAYLRNGLLVVGLATLLVAVLMLTVTRRQADAGLLVDGAHGPDRDRRGRRHDIGDRRAAAARARPRDRQDRAVSGGRSAAGRTRLHRHRRYHRRDATVAADRRVVCRRPDRPAWLAAVRDVRQRAGDRALIGQRAAGLGAGCGAAADRHRFHGSGTQFRTHAARHPGGGRAGDHRAGHRGGGVDGGHRRLGGPRHHRGPTRRPAWHRRQQRGSTVMSASWLRHRVSERGLIATAEQLWADSFRLALVAAHDDGDSLRVVYLFLAGYPDRRVELEYVVPADNPEIRSLAYLSFPAGRFEREMADLYGIRPVGHPKPRRLVRHAHWPDWHPMRTDAGPAPEFTDTGAFPFLAVEGPGVYEIPVGPVHAGLIEPGHFRFSVAGETIVRLKARLWFVHRGIEKLFHGRPATAAVDLAERISGDTSAAHALAHSLAIEDALGIELPHEVHRLRALIVELERLYNHAADLGALANDVGYSLANAHAQRIRENLLRRNAAVTGHRLLRGAIRAGGVALRALPDTDELAALAVDLAEVATLTLANSVVYDRFAGTAVLHPDDASALGCLGYVARASGLRSDARVEHPTIVLPITEIGAPDGDVLARYTVRRDEFAASAALAQHIVESHTGPIEYAATLHPVGAPSSGIGIVEGWRGTIVHRVEIDVDGRITRAKVVDPSWFNWPALPVAMADTIVPDFPLANKSFNQSYAGNDL